MDLSFYTPIAYDWKYAVKSVASYYDIADEIILAIDKDRISWSNYRYDEVVNFSKFCDPNKKIKIVEENFHRYSSPVENDTYERNFISSLCKKDNHIIAIDSDEILVNAAEFKAWMNNTNPDFDISCTWTTVYKLFDQKVLVTKPNETAVIGTNLRNSYRKCRITNNKCVLSPLQILHYSWGRTREEVVQKLKNWTHSNDFDVDEYMKIWDSVTLDNYKSMKYLHPLIK